MMPTILCNRPRVTHVKILIRTSKLLLSVQHYLNSVIEWFLLITFDAVITCSLLAQYD